MYSLRDSVFLRVLQAGKLVEGHTLDQMFASFYDELRRRAGWELGQGAPPSLGRTTLLHETFLSLSPRQSMVFADRDHFVAYAARVMRGIIIDHFRSRAAQKRGGHLNVGRLPTEFPDLQENAQSLELEKLRDALESLAAFDTRLAECVELKFFCGLSFADIARLRDVSERTVQRDWDKARLLLSHLMK